MEEIITAIVIILVLIYSFKPLFWPETIVDDRKTRLRRDLDGRA